MTQETLIFFANIRRSM